MVNVAHPSLEAKTKKNEATNTSDWLLVGSVSFFIHMDRWMQCFAQSSSKTKTICKVSSELQDETCDKNQLLAAPGFTEQETQILLRSYTMDVLS